MGLRNLQNGNYIIAYSYGNEGVFIRVINQNFNNLPSSVTNNENSLSLNNQGQVKLVQSGVNAIKMVWDQALTDMTAMFSDCSSLTFLDLSNFETSQVTNMEQMFFGCQSLTSLDLSNIDTSQVINMGSMFFGCKLLISLDLSNFNTIRVTDMYGMFSGCESLTSLDLSNFNTSQVTDTRQMFSECSALKFINLLYYQGKDIFENLGYTDLAICIGDYKQINGGENKLKQNNVAIVCLGTTIITFPTTITQTSIIKTTILIKPNIALTIITEGGNDNAKKSEGGNIIVNTTEGGNTLA